jgi:exonuclease SbcC
LRNQRLELDATINRAAGIINETSAQSAAAGARARAAVQSMEAARLESANEAAEFGKLRPSVATALAALGLMKPLPDSLEPRTQEQLTTLGFEAKESLTNAKALLADTKEIRTQLDAVRKQEGEAQTQFETQHRIKQERITQYHAAELELQRHSATQEKTNSETQTTERELLPFLASASIELEMLHKNASGVRVTISSLVTAYRQLKERAGSLEDAVRELEPKLAEASTILQANGELHTRCQALLGGAATATHRTRFNDERLAAIENQNSASATRNETASAHQGAVVAHQEAATALEEARARAGAAKSNFSQACAAAEHTCDWVVARLAVPAVERTEMQMRLQQIELAFNNASTNIKTRSADRLLAESVRSHEPGLPLAGHSVGLHQATSLGCSVCPGAGSSFRLVRLPPH